MQSIKISDLIPHPKNDFFFDDITGEKWREFVNSIRESGVRTPIIVTDQMVIVSGNQRVRACKELGISVIDAEVKHYASEDEVIKDLIEANIRQRGVISDSEVKAGRRLAELQRINGITQGGDRKSNYEKHNLKTQAELAEELGLSVPTLNELVRLSKAEPAIQQLVENGTVTKTAALSILSKLTQDEQKELAERLSGGEKQTGAEVQKLIADIADRDRKIRELENRQPEIKEVVKVPDDYESIKRKARLLEQDIRSEKLRADTKQKKILELEDEISELKNATKEGLDNANLSQNVYYFCTLANNFIGNVGGLVWLTDRIAEMQTKEKDLFLKAAYSFRDWALAFSQNLERGMRNERTEPDAGVPLLTD